MVVTNLEGALEAGFQSGAVAAKPAMAEAAYNSETFNISNPSAV